jgi:uncharacterized protein
VIVSNASPIHYLILTGDISILPALYEHLAIPDAVRDEMLHEETPSPVREWMTQPPQWLEIYAAPLPGVSGMLRDVGEAQAIALALELGAPGILLDDRKARATARRAGLLVVGTLGVLEAGAEKGLVDLRSALEKLVQDTNFRVDPKLVRTVLERHLGTQAEAPLLEPPAP